MTDTELRRLAEKATPGPWQYDGMTIDTRTYVEVVSATCAPCDYSGCSGARVDITDQDGRYIAAASPDVVIGLLDRIKALEVELDEARDLMPWRSDVVAFHQLAERSPPCDAAEDLASWCMMILRAHAAKGW